uniref:Uncharacterized protein n=1 Tax=Arundo donax TaxID=35708 RepID=A0A0A9GQK3_ARUDO
MARWRLGFLAADEVDG